MRTKKDRTVNIRVASEMDAEDLLKIYGPYVETTAITFEYEVPSQEEFKGRIHRTLEKYPYLVAEQDGKIIGYAYASAFHARAAYDWAVETSIYIDQNCKGLGVGRMLYDSLESELKKMNIINLYACIAYPKEEDEHLTYDSVRFHEKMGYRMIGEFYECGYKFNRWYNMVWMEKHIGVHEENPRPVKNFLESEYNV